MYVQALVSKGSVERFDEAIARWLAGSAEVDPHSMMIRPEIEHAPRELAAVVLEDTLRRAALCTRAGREGSREGALWAVIIILFIGT